MPDTAEDRAKLKSIIAPLREVSKLRGAKRSRVEPSRLTRDELLGVVHEIRAGPGDWLFHRHGFRPSGPDRWHIRESIRAVVRSFDDMLLDERSGGRFDLRAAAPVEDLRRIVEDMDSADPRRVRDATSAAGYLASLGLALADVFSFLASQGVLALTRVIVDRRSKRTTRGAIERVGRFFYFGCYARWMVGTLSEAAGTTPSPYLNVTVAGDEDNDGVALADLYAYCCGRIAREQDVDGSATAFVEGLGVASPRP